MLKRNLNTGGNIEEWSLLQKVYGSGSNYYLNGLMIPNNTYGLTFIVAGMPTDSEGNTWNTGDAPFRILSNGDTYVKRIFMNGESGQVLVRYDSGKTALQLNNDGLRFRLDDTNNNNFFFLNRLSSAMFAYLYDATELRIQDGVHGLSIASFKRQGDNSYPSTPETDIYYYCWYHKGQGYGSSGYQIATLSDISDKSVKKNIKKSSKSALDIVDKINFVQFNWNEKKIDRNGHIDIGIIAQDLKEIDENYVDITKIKTNDKENDVYYINTLNLLTTTTKAVQELNNKLKEQENTIKEQQKTIDELIEKIEKLEKGEK